MIYSLYFTPNHSVLMIDVSKLLKLTIFLLKYHISDPEPCDDSAAHWSAWQKKKQNTEVSLFNVGNWRKPESLFPASPRQDGIFISPAHRLC